MNLKSENGFVQELLTIMIILMVILLVGILGYSFFYTDVNNDDTDLVVAKDYGSNKNVNITKNNIENTTSNENKTNYNFNELIIDGNNTNTVIPSPDIKINNMNDNTIKYYYSQLSDTAKQIYNVMYESKDKLRTGNYTMDIPKSVSDILYTENGKQVLTEAFQDAVDAFRSDNSELFYIAFSKIILMTETTTRGNDVSYRLSLENRENETYFQDGFNDLDTVASAIKQVELKRREILSNITGSDYEKIKYIHDWVVDNVEYDSSTLRNNTHNLYGALIENQAVCDGYARAFKYLLDGLDIPCIIVQGTAINSDGVEESHAWNYVYINDNWYAVDTTWDDPIVNGGGYYDSSKHKYTYFLKGKENFMKDHQEDGKMSEEGKKFTYPEISYFDYY